jgi:hypothetical protein
MDATTPNSLPPPPVDGLATLSCQQGMLRIELQPRFAPWAKAVYFSLIPLFFAAIVSTTLCAQKIITLNRFTFGWSALCILGGIICYTMFIALLMGPLLKTLYGLVTCDGKSLFITDCKKQFVFPVDQIRSIRLAILKARSRRICPERRPSEFFRMAPGGALEIETPQGRLRLFRRWEIEELQWLHQTLNLFLNLKREAEAVPLQAPIVDSMRYAGESWKALFGICLVGTLLVIGVSGWPLYWGVSSRNWPSVMGTVVESRYDAREDNVVAELKYSYRVGDQSAEGEEIRFGGVPRDSGNQELIQSHPAGSAIKVYYDPKNVNRSVLLPGFNPFDGLFFGVGVLGLLGCGLIARKRPTRQQAALSGLYTVADTPARNIRPVSGDDAMNRLFK